MKIKILNTLAKEELISSIPKNLFPPSSLEKDQVFTLIQFPIDEHKSLVTFRELKRALRKNSPINKEQIVIVAGRFTQEARKLALDNNAICIEKREESAYFWTEDL